MFGFLVLIHLLICVFLILAIMIQQGKGASMGILSGASQTWFGPTGGKSLLMKITVGLAVAFLISSLLLAMSASQTRQLAAPPSPIQPPAGSNPPQ